MASPSQNRPEGTIVTGKTEERLEELGDGVFAHVQLDGGWCLNNSGIIVGSDSTVVVDTAATMRRAALLRDTVARLSPRPVTTVVNTHHHGDHCFGNCVFGPETSIVAHDLARTELDAGGLALTKLWPDVDWGDVRLRLPDLTFPEQITLHQGGHEIQLIHVGPAHTTNDIVAWLPGPRVLFAGDVVMNGAAPFTLMGSVQGSLAAIERLRALGPEVIVPGHGPVGGLELLDANARYLRWIQRLTAAGRAAGLTPLAVARTADFGEFADLIDGERIVGNLVRAYAEAAGGALGETLDVMAAFGQMIEFHGSTPTCFA
ncbi:Beta-lactamase precursor [Streptomyces reticuli]|nr:Beta-lactamase precursor [Streptomyces reticuli]